jgi:hypothetical protein
MNLSENMKILWVFLAKIDIFGKRVAVKKHMELQKLILHDRLISKLQKEFSSYVKKALDPFKFNFS